MITNERVKSRLMREVDKINEQLAQHEKIKRIELLPTEWTIENGEMTPKLSLKRKVILVSNKVIYDKIYESKLGL